MNRPIDRACPPAVVEPRHGIRAVAAIATVALLGATLYLSHAAAPPQSTVTGATPGRSAAGDDGAATARAVAAAEAFLESLDAKQRDRAVYEFTSPKRAGWSNLPVTMVPRNGVRLGDLTRKQRDAAMAAVAAVLSKEGYQKVVDIMDADQQLAEGKGDGKGPKGGKGGKGGKAMFGTDNYYLALFGKPSAREPWLLQFGGHHLGLNVTVVGKSFVVVPTHTGAQPTTFLRGGKEVRPLGPENDLAFKLVNSLDEKQRAQAVLGAEPGNLLLGPGQDAKKIDPQGLKGSAMSATQQAVLLDLVGAWVHLLPDAAAAARLAEIKGKVGETYFAWYGPTAPGSAVYYRVQGPTLVIEYAPQGGTNHIHTIIRSPENDYGKSLTRRE